MKPDVFTGDMYRMTAFGKEIPKNGEALPESEQHATTEGD